MRYMGGKSRIAKQLAEVIDRVRKPGQLVWDPFCGGLSMAVALSKNGPVWATDVNAALINMYRAVQAGWDPPTEVSRETYQAAKSLPDTDPVKAFCGVCCSFNGKWFGGYEKPLREVTVKTGRNVGRIIAVRQSGVNARRMKREVPCVDRFDCGDFLSVQPQPIECILYLDPPYRGTTSYAGTPAFDHDLFVQRVQAWEAHTHVFVSEYEFPLGRCVLEVLPKPMGARHVIQMAEKTAVERLYYLGPNQ